MINNDPAKRPDSSTALEKWCKIKAGLNPSIARWRLRKPDESVGERVVLDAIAAARQGIHSLTHLFNDDVRIPPSLRFIHELRFFVLGPDVVMIPRQPI